MSQITVLCLKSCVVLALKSDYGLLRNLDLIFSLCVLDSIKP